MTRLRVASNASEKSQPELGFRVRGRNLREREEKEYGARVSEAARGFL
jgi:hypothetical protein